MSVIATARHPASMPIIRDLSLLSPLQARVLPRARRRVATATLAVVALLVLLVPSAYAQEARVSLGAGAGMELPLSPSDRYAPTFAPPTMAGGVGPTLLVNQRPSVGLRLQLEAVIGDLAVRYGFHGTGWRKDRIRCVPAEGSPGRATLLPNGEFDDRTMDYDCRAPHAKQEPDADRRTRVVHTIEAATEIPALRPTRVIPYASLGGGLALSTYQTASQNTGIRLGVVAIVGGGLRIPIDRNVAIIFETRYSLTLMARGGDYSLRAGRAVAANKTVLSAVIDPYHGFQTSVGIRVRVR